jgi:hypothetical protein
MVFDNRVLRRIFGPKRDGVTGEWRKIYNKELLNKYYAGDQIEKNEVCGPRNVWGRGEVYTGFWWENPRKRDNLEDPGVDARII